MVYLGIAFVLIATVASRSIAEKEANPAWKLFLSPDGTKLELVELETASDIHGNLETKNTLENTDNLFSTDHEHAFSEIQMLQKDEDPIKDSPVFEKGKLTEGDMSRERHTNLQTEGEDSLQQNLIYYNADLDGFENDASEPEIDSNEIEEDGNNMGDLDTENNFKEDQFTEYVLTPKRQFTSFRKRNAENNFKEDKDAEYVLTPKRQNTLFGKRDAEDNFKEEKVAEYVLTPKRQNTLFGKRDVEDNFKEEKVAEYVLTPKRQTKGFGKRDTIFLTRRETSQNLAKNTNDEREEVQGKEATMMDVNKPNVEMHDIEMILIPNDKLEHLPIGEQVLADRKHHTMERKQHTTFYKEHTTFYKVPSLELEGENVIIVTKSTPGELKKDEDKGGYTVFRRLPSEMEQDILAPGELNNEEKKDEGGHTTFRRSPSEMEQDILAPGELNNDNKKDEGGYIVFRRSFLEKDNEENDKGGYTVFR